MEDLVKDFWGWYGRGTNGDERMGHVDRIEATRWLETISQYDKLI